MNAVTGLWVFGYGSLCWHPGFDFEKSLAGYIRGFTRKFWQGNVTHRGTADKPGRVATLIEDKEGIAWGRAFELRGNAALPYLEKRECTLGGYMTKLTTFYTRDGNQSFPALVYIATSGNQHWLGDAPVSTIANQITECSGPSGHNVEYLLRLADFMHQYLPDAQDEHLFTLEMLVRARIKEEKLCLKTLMGNREFDINLNEVDEPEGVLDDRLEDDNVAHPLRQESFQFTSRVPSKTLRCLNI
ncbi:glutathione-specific gamma-glutamylcyclotransferase 1 [Neodiprion lecontei]|uniref:glutathione-specific gamma-glutamylcyclotransferase n=1 Tax=Neodiprion lecontei TaxID=441921 RepID=A0A6J0BJ94_NEOLC|nr:glutathione-specific gamma-glutamylcyclotransferase 1 [Neodiprion lecontei]